MSAKVKMLLAAATVLIIAVLAREQIFKQLEAGQIETQSPLDSILVQDQIALGVEMSQR